MGDPERVVGPGRRVEDGIVVIRPKVTWEWRAHWWVVCSSLWDAVKEVKPDIIHTYFVVIASSTFQVL